MDGEPGWELLRERAAAEGAEAVRTPRGATFYYPVLARRAPFPRLCWQPTHHDYIVLLQMYANSVFAEPARVRMLAGHTRPDGTVEYARAAADGALPLTAPGLAYVVLAVRVQTHCQHMLCAVQTHTRRMHVPSQPLSVGRLCTHDAAFAHSPDVALLLPVRFDAMCTPAR